jgi:hypothetical protein
MAAATGLGIWLAAPIRTDHFNHRRGASSIFCGHPIRDEPDQGP